MAHPGIDDALFRRRPSARGDGGCSTSAASTRARASTWRWRRWQRCPTRPRLTVLGSGDERVPRRAAELSARLGVDGRVDSGFARATSWPTRTRRRTRCCSRSAGRSPGGSCRWRRWRSARRSSQPGRAAPRSTCATVRTPGGGPRCDAEELAAAVERLASDPGLRRRLREEGPAHGGPLHRARVQRGDRGDAARAIERPPW